jgi:hypothetical protein
MLSLSARVSRGPNKGRPLTLARNPRGKFITAVDKTGAGRVEHDSEEAAARHVYQSGHGAFFSANGRGAQAAFHKPRRGRAKR